LNNLGSMDTMTRSSTKVICSECGWYEADRNWDPFRQRSDSEKTRTINFALRHPDPDAGYHRFMNWGDKEHMDTLLAKAKHPARKLGTNKERFLALHKAKHQF
jgi:hypothetical protein